MLTAEVTNGYDARLRSRGWDEVDGCWEIKGAHTGSGYVQLNVPRNRGRYMSAHRMAYLAWVGDIPDGFVVRHKVCDNKRCVNPQHLDIGTQQENIDDKVSKGRQARGSTHGNAKIDEEIARQIVHLRNAGVSQAQVAETFDIKVATVKSVFNGLQWRHATHEIPRMRRNYRSGVLLSIDYV